ncbi:MAG: inositol monophosphatase family protein [Sporolactobacillus sp.]
MSDKSGRVNGMQTMNWAALEKRVTEWIYEAGERIKGSFSDSLDVQTKSAYNDLVTNIDRATEQFLIGQIRSVYPDHQIVSEEGFGDRPTTTDGFVWFVDPIDGTLNFVRQKRFFAISIAVYQDGVGKAAFIYDVAADELFHCLAGKGVYRNNEQLQPIAECTLKDAMIDLSMTWIKKNKRIDESVLNSIIEQASGTRSYGAASLELAYVACGMLNAYFTMRLAPWDFAAGILLIQELGGKVTRVDGRQIDLLAAKTSLLAASGELHEWIAAHIRQQISEGKYVNEPNSVN